MLGLTPRQWEEMTPAQLNEYARGCGQLREDREKQRQAEIYSLAALIRAMVWAKSPPSFEAAFPEAAPKTEMDDDAMLLMARAINKALGGAETDAARDVIDKRETNY